MRRILEHCVARTTNSSSCLTRGDEYDRQTKRPERGQVLGECHLAIAMMNRLEGWRTVRGKNTTLDLVLVSSCPPELLVEDSLVREPRHLKRLDSSITFQNPCPRGSVSCPTRSKMVFSHRVLRRRQHHPHPHPQAPRHTFWTHWY